jgi:hypothetical protein
MIISPCISIGDIESDVTTSMGKGVSEYMQMNFVKIRSITEKKIMFAINDFKVNFVEIAASSYPYRFFIYLYMLYVDWS